MVEESGTAFRRKSRIHRKRLFNSWEEIAASPVQTFSDVQPGDVRYEDINKDGQIDVNDMVPIGYGDIPRIMYGINLGVGYKGFSITALFQGAAKSLVNIRTL